MTDHMVSGHVRIFPNPRRSAYETSGCSKEISRIQLKVSILKYPAPVIKLTSTKFVHRCVSLPNLKKGEKFQKFENFMKSFEMFKSLRNLESPQIH